MTSLGKVIEALEAMNVLVTKPMKASVGFKLSVFIKKVQPEYEAFTKKRDELLKELGTSEDGEKYTIPRANIDKYTETMNDLLNMEVDINIPKIKLDDIKDIDIEAKYIYMLMGNIEEDSDAVK